MGYHDLSWLSRKTREIIWKYLRAPIVWNRRETDMGDQGGADPNRLTGKK